MIKNAMKLTAVSAATLLLAGCFSASSINRDAPAPVQPTPAPVQQPAPAPAKEYVLSGDFLFDFDKSNLSAKGKSTLNNIAKDLKAAGMTKVTITGYTDRLGSAAYNLKLSQARANTAKAYLQAQGVKANIKAIGRGKANQVKACKHESGQALKGCLKPNRRVVIRAQ
ncbi:OmpA family protein [Muribacter muris]|uniref:OmpA family protein n=1 Tax=Muribacter muris TaxID=67855 RepID=A0A4Y9K5Q2_9PAST|nr:OmpA family protein [Muribacter muris]MBF0784062.1 OmpA family protein [Muribacter muris]MBF0827557.1 OmpA family protein [Muribacter muris]TFV13118.1 OmpA family protein [Muribacter muris]